MVSIYVYDSGMAVTDRLTTREVCARLRCHRSTIWKMLRRGEFPQPIVVCNRHLWTEADISQWEEANRRQANRQEAA